MLCCFLPPTTFFRYRDLWNLHTIRGQTTGKSAWVYSKTEMEPFSMPPFSRLSLFSINLWAKRHGAITSRLFLLKPQHYHNTNCILWQYNVIGFGLNRSIFSNAAKYCERTAPQPRQFNEPKPEDHHSFRPPTCPSTNRALPETQLCAHTVNRPHMWPWSPKNDKPSGFHFNFHSSLGLIQLNGTISFSDFMPDAS